MSDIASARPDLCLLSDPALAQMANLGLLKRALREHAAGEHPALQLEANNTVIATFSDGVITRFPPDKPLNQSTCSCSAPGLCRHRLIAVLHLRHEAAPVIDVQESELPADVPSPMAAARSPGIVSDEELARLLPAAALVIAGKECDRGLSADVHYPSVNEPCHTVRLLAATVRFWGGHYLQAARCDCVQQSLCVHIALGVWAFRQADALGSTEPGLRVQLGVAGRAERIGLAPYLALCEALLANGIAQGNQHVSPALSTALADADSHKAEWLTQVLADLDQWSAAYSSRSALFTAEAGVDLLTELFMRIAVGGQTGRAQSVLGTGLPHEVDLDRLRLITLGARIRADGNKRASRLILADADTGARMVLLQEWTVPDDHREDEDRLRDQVLIAPGVRLPQLAGGQLLALNAKRRSDGRIFLSRSRKNHNSLLPSPDDWTFLIPPLRYTHVDTLRQARAIEPHAHCVPRHAAGSFVIVSPAAIEAVRFDPHQLMLHGIALDEAGSPLLFRRTHAPHTPQALETLALALTEPIRHLAGLLTWQGATPVIEVWSVVGDHHYVLDFAQSTPSAREALARVPLGSTVEADDYTPLQGALKAVHGLCGELMHHGQIHLPCSWTERAEACTHELESLGFVVLSKQWAHLCKLLNASTPFVDEQKASQCFAAVLTLRQLHVDAIGDQITGPSSNAPASEANAATV